jgi:hypothetical protein
MVAVVAGVAVAIGATAAVLRAGDGRGGWAAKVWATGLTVGVLTAVVWFLPVPVWAKIAADAVAVLAGILLAARTAATIPPPTPMTTSPIPYGQWRP